MAAEEKAAQEAESSAETKAAKEKSATVNAHTAHTADTLLAATPPSSLRERFRERGSPIVSAVLFGGLILLLIWWLCFMGSDERCQSARHDPSRTASPAPSRAASPAPTRGGGSRAPSPVASRAHGRAHGRAPSPGPARRPSGWRMQLRDGKEFKA